MVRPKVFRSPSGLWSAAMPDGRLRQSSSWEVALDHALMWWTRCRQVAAKDGATDADVTWDGLPEETRNG